jgi:4a-hydroxytetrahydrobiopterin dehydratase
MLMAKLSSEQIEEQLKPLTGWEYKDNALRKLYRFKEFMDGIRFINQIAEFAESIDHHPDIYVNYTRVTFICSTHDQGGVTAKDFRLANEIERRSLSVSSTT